MIKIALKLYTYSVKDSNMEKFDVVIIGAGLGGLFCGAILSKEGMKVLILERHHRIGGCLQSFHRNGRILDTGMHYVGSMCEGQIMHLYLKYLNVFDSLQLRKLDESGFEHIYLPNGKTYRYAMGYERFVDTLATDFPNEYDGLKQYCRILQDINQLISPQMLKQGRITDFDKCMKYMSLSAAETINSCVKDPILRNVLAGTNGLYAGDRNTTSLYEHSIINSSNIEGCCYFIDGSQQLADKLAEQIFNNQGEIRKSSEVTRIHISGLYADYVELKEGERIYAKNVISSLHPATTMSLLGDNSIIRKSFHTRINSLSNTYGLFTTYLLMRPNVVPYINHNRWYYNTNDVWSIDNGRYKGYELPVMLVISQPNRNSNFTEVVTILMPMHRQQIEQWWTTSTGKRGNDYESFKRRYSEIIIDYICQFDPDLRPYIDYVYTATPLTYRDYTGTPEGSAYGVSKDYHNPLAAYLPVKMKIPNLYLTGQSINVHGCLGTSISAVVTCGELLGTKYLTKKISNA